MWILYLLLLILLGAVAYMLVGYRHMSHGLQRVNMMMQNLSSYAFLIDKNFEVKETNYYALNPAQTQTKDSPQILGNVLHCSVACAAGTCGSGQPCKHCPVRFVITKSFERKNDFNDLEVSMELTDDKQQVTDVDVNVGGRYVSVDGQPYMVLNVKDVTESKRLLRRYIDKSLREESDPSVPKLLYASHDVARYSRMREMLKDCCRVVYVETPEQVLRRVGKKVDYGYTAVLFDEAFLHAYDIVDQLNEHIVVILLTEDGRVGLDGHRMNVPQNISDDELVQIIRRQFVVN